MKFDDGSQELLAVVLFSQSKSSFEGNPCSCGIDDAYQDNSTRRGVTGLTLIFSISTLHLFMLPLLNFAFKNAGTLGFVKTSNFQYLSRVEPRI